MKYLETDQMSSAQNLHVKDLRKKKKKHPEIHTRSFEQIERSLYFG